MSGTEFQAPLPYATYNSFYISQNGFILFKERYDWKKPIRSLTIRAINLESSDIPRQVNIFDDFSKLAKLENLEDVMFSLHQRYGTKSVYPARLMEDIKIAKQVPYDIKPPGLPVF